MAPLVPLEREQVQPRPRGSTQVQLALEREQQGPQQGLQQQQLVLLGQARRRWSLRQHRRQALLSQRPLSLADAHLHY